MLRAPPSSSCGGLVSLLLHCIWTTKREPQSSARIVHTTTLQAIINHETVESLKLIYISRLTELGHVIWSTFLIGAGFFRPKIFRVKWKYFPSRSCYHWVGSLDFSVINLSLSAESEDCESVTSCEDCESEISCEDCEPVKSCEIWKQIWVIPNRSYCQHWFMFILLDSCSQIL